MRRAVLLVVLSLAGVALGAGVAGAVEPDPGKALVARLLVAASKHDAKGIWNLLSSPSQHRLGPTFAAFKASRAARIENALVPFENRAVTPFISQNLTARFGIVAIRSGVRALAFPLRRDHEAWKIETPGPLQMQILGPQPGSRGRVVQIAFEAKAPAPIGDGVIFV